MVCCDWELGGLLINYESVNGESKESKTRSRRHSPMTAQHNSTYAQTHTYMTCIIHGIFSSRWLRKGHEPAGYANQCGFNSMSLAAWLNCTFDRTHNRLIRQSTSISIRSSKHQHNMTKNISIDFVDLMKLWICTFIMVFRWEWKGKSNGNRNRWGKKRMENVERTSCAGSMLMILRMRERNKLFWRGDMLSQFREWHGRKMLAELGARKNWKNDWRINWLDIRSEIEIFACWQNEPDIAR